MKKLLITLMVMIGLMGCLSSKTYAGDGEWATAGKVLAGVMGASIVANAVSYDNYYYPRSYYHTRTYYQPTYYRPVYTPRYCRPVYQTYSYVPPRHCQNNVYVEEYYY